MTHPGLKLRQLMQTQCVAAPGAFNGLVARLVCEAQFPACYVSGAAITAAMGLPDVGIVGMEHFTRVIKEVVTVSGLPCIADADTGFGEAEAMRRTVIEYNTAGAAGLHVEDQVMPKRCGHLLGKQLVSTSHMCEKVRWAVEASRSVSDEHFIVCARTDARSVEGIESAIERAKQYVDSGAHMIFPEGLQSREEFAQFAKAMSLVKVKGGGAPQGGPYLLANMTEFGQSPLLKLADLKALGYHIVIFPVTTLRAAMKPVQKVLETIRDEGSAEGEVGNMFSRQELYSSLQYQPGVEWKYPSTTNNSKS